jgi:hypothetical protein
MHRVLLRSLSLVLLASTLALAGPAEYAFDAYRTPGFVVLVPEGGAFDGLGPAIETLYASVSDLWLPDLGVCGGIADYDQAAIPLPEVDRMRRTFSAWNPDCAERMPGSCAPVPCTVIVYRTGTDHAWDYCAFDSAGRYYVDLHIESRRDLQASMRRIAARLARPVDLPPTGSYVSISGYPDGHWESALAHEFTHLLQYQTELTWAIWDLDLPVSVRLLFEGMATRTEFRLGFRDCFNETVLQPAAHWIQLGGHPAEAPDHILYEVGTALVDAVCRLAGEATFWKIFSPLGFGVDPLGWYDRDLTEDELREIEAAFEAIVGGDWMTYGDMAFEDRFRLNTGGDWSAFLDRWIAEMNVVEVTPAGEAVFEWRRRNVSLRIALLGPILDLEALDRLNELRERLFDGAGSVADVDEADGLLATAPSAIGEDTLDELTWRVPTLTKWINLTGGAGAAQSIYRMSDLLVHADEDPEPYVQAYIEAVNGQLIWPVPPESPADG